MSSSLPTSPDALIHAFTTNSAPTKPFLLDLNPNLTYVQSHPNYATNIPFLDLPNRLNELPPAPCTILVLVEERHRTSAVDLLQSRGYTPVMLRCPIGELVSGVRSRAMWRPSPVVETFITSSSIKGKALDIACGSGRDAKFLTLHGLNVTAVDRDKNLLTRARNLHNANYYNPLWKPVTEGDLTTIQHTFGTDRHVDINFLRAHTADLMIVVRFLRRGVLENLHEGVAPGGYVLYEHFLDGCEEYGGPMKKSQRLRRGELRNMFSIDRGFNVIRDDEETLADGRPVARFIARRMR